MYNKNELEKALQIVLDILAENEEEYTRVEQDVIVAIHELGLELNPHYNIKKI